MLSDKQLSKARVSLLILSGVLIVQGSIVMADKYWYQDEEYEKMQVKLFPRGQIVEYTNLEEFCDR